MTRRLMTITGRSGEYILLKEIGKGGMGSVWSANWLGPVGKVIKAVAIKFLRGFSAMSEDDRERLLNEAGIMAQLNRGGFVSIFDVGETDDGDLFLVMELVDGVNLKEFVEAVGQLEVPEINFVMLELITLVNHAHSFDIGGVPAGIIHYDIKRENIMISSSGELKLTDFGIARFAASADATMSHAIGTHRYMPPEQMMGRTRMASDIYCAGAVWWELLHPGRKFRDDIPVERFQQTVLGGHVPEFGRPDLLELWPWIPSVLRRMLDPNPDARPTAAELREIFLKWMQDGHLAGPRLEALYLKKIGRKRSNLTGVYEFGLNEPNSSAARQTPRAQAAAPTAVEPRNEHYEEDSPVVFRRERNRVTPTANGTSGQVSVRTSTEGPPMLDAILQPAMVKPRPTAEKDPVVIAEPPPAPIAEPLVEPTEVLPPMFPEEAPLGRGRRRLTPPASDLPESQTLQFPGGRPVPIANVPSASGSLARVSGPHQRTAALVVIGVLAVVVASLLVIVVVLTVNSQASSAEQPETVESRNVDVGADKDKLSALIPEPSSASTTDPQTDSTELEPEPKQEPETEPKPALPTEVANEPTTSSTDELSSRPGDGAELTSAETAPVEPEKPKKAATISVVFFIDSVPKGQIEVDGRTITHSSMTAIDLRSGKKYPIRWRRDPGEAWHSSGTLNVKALPKKHYYEVRLFPSTLKVATKEEGK